MQAAEMFLDELDRAIERIWRSPRAVPRIRIWRGMVLRRFPYLLVFRQTAAGVEVTAAAHGRRRPGYWRDRVE